MEAYSRYLSPAEKAGLSEAAVSRHDIRKNTADDAYNYKMHM